MAEAGTKRWTLAEIEALPYDEWTRYEIIDGELFVSTAPGDHHQAVYTRGAVALGIWESAGRPIVEGIAEKLHHAAAIERRLPERPVAMKEIAVNLKGPPRPL